MTEQKLGDLLANSITHGLGVLLASAGAVCLMVAAARGTPRVIVACAVYAFTLVLVYLCSTLYHSLVCTRARYVFRALDHSAIYLLIAGTYTPFTLVSLQGPWGWTLFGIVWGLAIAGVIFKSLAVERFAVASAIAYVLMGWIAIVAVMPLARAITWHGILWIGAGGIFTRSGYCFLLSTGSVISTHCGMCLCWREAVHIFSRFSFMLFRIRSRLTCKPVLLRATTHSMQYHRAADGRERDMEMKFRFPFSAAR